MISKRYLPQNFFSLFLSKNIDMIEIQFAPIQGITDYIYRNAHHKVFGGVSQYFTPFIRVEKGEIRKQDKKDILKEHNKELQDLGLITPQLMANNADDFDILSAEIELQGYSKADINMGCPFPLIARKGKGAGILSYPDKIKDILKCAENHPGLQFSLKMRIGMTDVSEGLNAIQLINDSCIKSVCIHPRLGKQEYKGNVDFNAFSEMLKNCNKPVIYNGDILNIQDMDNRIKQFNTLNGIMIGRGLISNPFLANQYQTRQELSVENIILKIKDFSDLLLAGYSEKLEGGERQIVERMNAIWEYMDFGVDKRLRKKIIKSTNIASYKENVIIALKSLQCQDK